MAEITDDYLTLPILATKRTLIISFKKSEQDPQIGPKPSGLLWAILGRSFMSS